MVQMKWYQYVSANYDNNNDIYIYFALNCKNVKYNDSAVKSQWG